MLNLLLRTALMLMGLLFAASLALAALLLVTVWMMRAAWARLTGQPVTPWVMRFDPRSGFEHFRAAARQERAPRAADVAGRRAQVGRHGADIEDVVVKPTSRLQ